MDKALDNLLTRGVLEILPSKKSLEDLMMKKKITLYQGFDPTHSSLHVGHFVGVRKLAEFQRLGHKVIFLIGDFTGMIGDPTDKSSVRQKLTKDQVKTNLKEYTSQVERIIDFEGNNPAEIKFNSKWLGKLTFKEVIELASNLTVQQMLEREFFQERIKREKPIYLHEFLYPLMQGYDSVVMEVDLEVGGSDQLFNMLTGRTLMKTLKNKQKFVMTTKLLGDALGKKMGKTEGNAFFLSDPASEIFGKMMSFPDELMKSSVELLTDFPLDFGEKENPMDTKKKIAFDVVRQIKGEKEASEAQKHFETTFQKKSPDFSKEVTKKSTILDIVAGQVGSKTEAKRLLSQNAVDIDKKTITDPLTKIEGGEKIKIGKKTFVKVKN